MAEHTKIAWANSTFNCWVGCEKVSPACDHCYAESWAKRTGHPELWTGERRRTTEAYWRGPLKWNAKAAAAGEPWRVFCASLADVFDEKVPLGWRSDLFSLISETQNLTWMLLTKRPQHIAEMMPKCHIKGGVWPNVWLGTTAENQEEADKRIPCLLEASARVHFVSAEPMLGPLDLRVYMPNLLWNDLPSWKQPELSWVICGGESGPGARPMRPEWARSLRDQCDASDVPFFFKQWGGRTPKSGGRLLDGREWNELPNA